MSKLSRSDLAFVYLANNNYELLEEIKRKEKESLERFERFTVVWTGAAIGLTLAALLSQALNY